MDLLLIYLGCGLNFLSLALNSFGSSAIAFLLMSWVPCTLLACTIFLLLRMSDGSLLIMLSLFVSSFCSVTVRGFYCWITFRFRWRLSSLLVWSFGIRWFTEFKASCLACVSFEGRMVSCWRWLLGYVRNWSLSKDNMVLSLSRSFSWSLISLKSVRSLFWF